MIGDCDCCDRQNVPVRHFEAGTTNAQCETTACFICQGDTETDPYGEMDDSRDVPSTEVLSSGGKFFPNLRTDEAQVANVSATRCGICICQDHHRRGFCTEPACPFALTPSAVFGDQGDSIQAAIDADNGGRP